MEEFIAGLMQKVGVDRATAEKVFNFLKENATKVPEWIGSNETAKGVVDKVGLGGLMGKLPK